MSFTCFRDFGELYRAAFAETDEQRKANLLREIDRIIQNTQLDLPTDINYEAKAA